MKLFRLYAVLLVGLCSLPCAVTRGESPVAGKQVEQEFETSDSAKVPYLLYLPKDYQPNQKQLPLILFLHGRGESDGPLSVVAQWGPPQMVARGDQLPYIVVSPQCPKEDSWGSATQQARLIELLDMITEKYSVDAGRVYLTGLSMGGSGSWRLAAGHPRRFAAVVPICGRGDIKDASALKDLPIWVFVGDQDGVFKQSEGMVEAIRQAGSKKIRFTTLEHVGHNSWSAAYATPELYRWMDDQASAKN